MAAPSSETRGEDCKKFLVIYQKNTLAGIEKWIKNTHTKRGIDAIVETRSGGRTYIQRPRLLPYSEERLSLDGMGASISNHRVVSCSFF
jgi:hypothetical protein